METYQSHLTGDEAVSEGVEQLLNSLERQGWYVHLRRGNRLRYWCSCPTQHQMWAELFPETPTYPTDTGETLSKKSCFEQ